MALAAVAATVAVLAWVTSGRIMDRKDSAPAQQITPSSVAVAFLDAFGSFDRARAASYLGRHADLAIFRLPSAAGPDPWRRYNRWLERVGFQLLNPSCAEDADTLSGRSVLCAFDLHALGSEQLGRGPFRDNLFKFVVRGHQIVAAQMVPNGASGYAEQMWEPFAAWVARVHPGDAAEMYADWPEHQFSRISARATDLWAMNVEEYVRTHQ